MGSQSLNFYYDFLHFASLSIKLTIRAMQLPREEYCEITCAKFHAIYFTRICIEEYIVFFTQIFSNNIFFFQGCEPNFFFATSHELNIDIIIMLFTATFCFRFSFVSIYASKNITTINFVFAIFDMCEISCSDIR